MFVSFRELTSADFKRDPFPLLTRLRESGPLAETKIPLFGKLHLATTYNAVDQMLRDRQKFVLEAQNAGVGRWGDFRNWLPRSIRVLANNMLQKDEPDHRRLRSLAEQAFRRKNVASMENDITKLADELIDRFEDAPVVDLIDKFARALPLSVICELLGLPLEDRPKFSKWISRLTNVSLPYGLVTIVPGILQINRYLKRRFQIERTNPSGGLISGLVAAEEDGQQLDEDELLAMTFILFVAGHETTTHMISLSMLTMLQREDLRTDWMDNPDVRPTAVDELLRYHSPVQLTKPRYCAADTELDGEPIKQGERVMGFLAGANVDPNKFENPETIDLRRSPNPHMGFGSGIHFCLGAQLARLEAQIAITRLLERFPKMTLAINEDELRWASGNGIRSLKEMPVAL